ncbi:hypothetical protein D3C72_1377290 [compost metagenome]
MVETTVASSGRNAAATPTAPCSTPPPLLRRSSTRPFMLGFFCASSASLRDRSAMVRSWKLVRRIQPILLSSILALTDCTRISARVIETGKVRSSLLR